MTPRGLSMLLLLASAPLFAQNATLRVRVLNSGGSAIQAAEVSLSAKGAKPRLADRDGMIVFNRVAEGKVEISASAPGYKLRLVDAVVKRAGETYSVIELETDHSYISLDDGPALPEYAPSSVPLTLGSRVRIHVTDTRRIEIDSAEAVVEDVDGKPERGKHANAKGEIVLSFVPTGRHRIIVRAPGYRNRQINVVVGADTPLDLKAVLQRE